MPTRYHEPRESLSKDTVFAHRALESLIEELEAIDWYSQRMDVTEDEELRGILAHNRSEEIEHAAMLMEYLRRKDAKFEKELKTYLFTEKKIIEVEDD